MQTTNEARHTKKQMNTQKDEIITDDSDRLPAGYVTKTYIRVNYIVPIRYKGVNSKGVKLYTKVYAPGSLTPIEDAPIAMIADTKDLQDTFIDADGIKRMRVERVTRIVKEHTDLVNNDIIVTEAGDIEAPKSKLIPRQAAPEAVVVESMNRRLQQKKKQ